MKRLNSLLLGSLVSMVLLTACGGGSSSGGAGAFAGTYIGPATVTLSAGGGSNTVTGNLQIVIKADGTVSVGDPGKPPVVTAKASLSGNMFTVNVPASFVNQPGVTCTGVLVTKGTIIGTKITGTMSSNQFKCNGVPFAITGNFTAQKTANARANVAPGAMELLRSALSSST